MPGGLTFGGGLNVGGFAPFTRVPTFDWKDPNSLLAAMASTLPDFDLSTAMNHASSSSVSGQRSNQGSTSFGSQGAFNNASGFGVNSSKSMGGVGGSGGYGGGGGSHGYGYNQQGSTGGSSGSQGSRSSGSSGGYSASSSTDDSTQSTQGVRGQSAKMGGFANVAAVMADQLMKQGRFDQMWPWLQGQWGDLQAQNNSVANGPGPEITASQIWNPQQLQAQINAGQASNQAQAATNIRNMQEGLGGRGMGATSPLAQALMGQQQASTLAANSDLARQSQLTAGQANADQLLKAQSAREQQFASRAQEDIERKKVITGQMNALLGALTGLI